MREFEQPIINITESTPWEKVQYLSIFSSSSPPFVNINVMIAPENFKKASHVHEDFYHVNTLLKGDLSIVIENKQYDLDEGMVFVLPPNVPHALYSKNGYTQIGIDVECENDTKGLFNEFANLCNGFSVTKLIFSQSVATLLLEKMSALLSTPTTANVLRAINVVEAHFLDFLDKLRGDSGKEFSLRFNEMIKSYNPWEMSLDDMCKHLLISRSELERQSHTAFGCGASEYCARLRFSKACEMLQNDKSLTNIVEELGFCDLGHFSRFFTKRAKMPPGQYRKTLQ